MSDISDKVDKKRFGPFEESPSVYVSYEGGDFSKGYLMRAVYETDTNRLSGENIPRTEREVWKQMDWKQRIGYCCLVYNPRKKEKKDNPNKEPEPLRHEKVYEEKVRGFEIIKTDGKFFILAQE